MFVDAEVRKTCLESFAQTCYELAIRMEACEFAQDHVHLFVSRCKNYSVPYMVQRLKGASSRRIRQELWERVKGKLWGDSFWSDGYFYRSVGSTTAEAVQYYVQNSQRRHWYKPEYEQVEVEQERGTQASLTDFA